MIRMSDNEDAIPKHIAIIMDGNGRWAKSRGFPRWKGHEAGAESVRRVIEACIETKVEYLTLYAFSTENWLRSDEAVEYLMFFNRDILIRRRDEFNQKGVRFRFLGDLTDEKIPDENKELMGETENLTQNNTELNLNFAFNYGSHDEIHNAVLNLHNLNLNKKLTLKDVKDSFINYFQYPEVPFPDLLLRTAGENRISNFLLYQLSYTELVFVEDLWPDINADILDDVLLEFNSRNRTYGKN